MKQSLAVAVCIWLLVVVLRPMTCTSTTPTLPPPTLPPASTTAIKPTGVPRVVIPPRNTTVMVTGSLLLQCEVSGEPRPKVRWEHAYERVRRRGSNFRVLKSGSLRIEPVLIRDRGYYRCVAELGDVSDASPYVFVYVQAPAAIVKGPTDRVVAWGSQVNLDCVVVGEPTPRITWKKNGKTLVDRETGRVYDKQELRLNATATATYQCEASNRHVTLGNSDLLTETVVNQNATVTVRHIGGECDKYSGHVCRHYLGSRLLWYNASVVDPAQAAETRVIRQVAETIDRFSAFCREPAHLLACHSAFPDCDPDGIGYPKPKPLCREHCLAVKDLYCYKEWQQMSWILLENSGQKSGRRSGGRKAPPDRLCVSLPSLHDDPDKCTSADLFKRNTSHITTSCYEGSGQDYNGTVNTTVQGVACQAWATQKPHQHLRQPQVYPMLENSLNFCRNPGGERERPWCFTQDADQRWGYCPVSKCDAEDPFDEDLTSKTALEKFFTPRTILIVASMAVICFTVTGITVGLCCRLYTNRARRRYTATPQQGESEDIDIDMLPANACYQKRPPSAELDPRLLRVQYPRNNIVHLRDIGKGAFGRIFFAKAPAIVKGEEWTLLAVKMLRADASDQMQQDFEREATLLVEFDHPNIIKLLGVCAIGQPMCLLFEFMCKGDLKDFLRQCSPEHFIPRNRSREVLTDDTAKLTHVQQLDIARQVASAMVYVSERGYVHRDLAARNCLVGENLTVKISDLGMTRSILDRGSYEGSDHEAIPVRWMPLSAILYNRFTRESDIWSFGVVLWEIFSFALQPYYGLNHEEVVRYVRDGKVLSCPDNTPPQVYDLMKTCWAQDPKFIPPFVALYESICRLQEELKPRKRPDKDRL